LRDDRHRSGRKTLAQRAKSGDLEVKRKATWGMSVDVLRFDPSKIILSQGLAPGEMIVSAGTQALHPGQRVRPGPQSAAASPQRP